MPGGVLRLCACVVNLLLIYSFDCIVLAQNHNDHYQYFTSVMHLYFLVVCSWHCCAVGDSTLWSHNLCE